MDFIAFDVETANEARASICAVGAVRVIGGEVSHRYYSLVNPECPFRDFNIAIHGITPRAVADAPTFPQLLPALLDFFGDLPVVAYNVSFDAGCMESAAYHYGLQPPTFCYYDALHFARGAGLGLPSYTLDAVAVALGLPHFAHHNAAEDAHAAALVTLVLADRLSASSLCDLDRIAERSVRGRADGCSFACSRRRGYSHTPKACGPVRLRGCSPYHGKTFCITGDFSDFSRDEAIEIVQQVGCYKSGVSRRIDYLLVAHVDLHGVHELGLPMTGKHAKAVEMGIPILDENDFLAAILEP